MSSAYGQEEGGSKGVWVLLGGVVLLGALVAIYFNVATKPSIIPPPTQFAAYTAPDKAFVCVRPTEWEKLEGSSHAVESGALFKKGKAKIDITADLQGSLMGDILTSSNAQTDSLAGMMPGGAAAGIRQQRPPVEKLHLAARGAMEKKYKEYEEQNMLTMQSKLGEARYSEWTGDAGMSGGGKVHGYRVTVLSGDKRVSVLCHCPETSWANLKPAFGKVIGSLSPGGS